MKKIGIALVLIMSTVQAMEPKKQTKNEQENSKQKPIEELRLYKIQNGKMPDSPVSKYTQKEFEVGGKIYRDLQRIHRCRVLTTHMLYKVKDLLFGAACIHMAQRIIQAYVSK